MSRDPCDFLVLFSGLHGDDFLYPAGITAHVQVSTGLFLGFIIFLWNSTNDSAFPWNLLVFEHFLPPSKSPVLKPREGIPGR